METGKMQGLVMSVIEEALQKEQGRYTADKDKVLGMVNFGVAVDMIAQEAEIGDVAVSVNAGTRDGLVSFDADEIVFNHGASHLFFKSIADAKSVKFERTKSEAVRVTAIFSEVLVPKE